MSQQITISIIIMTIHQLASKGSSKMRLVRLRLVRLVNV